MTRLGWRVAAVVAAVGVVVPAGVVGADPGAPKPTPPGWEDPGAAGWGEPTQLIPAGSGPTPVVAGGVVTRFYRGILGRVGDPGGLEHWGQVAARDGSVAAVAAMLGSGEVRRLGDPMGMSAGGFVDWVYERALGRTPDPVGRWWWQMAVARGDGGVVPYDGAVKAMVAPPVTRAEMVVAVLESDEFEERYRWR